MAGGEVLRLDDEESGTLLRQPRIGLVFLRIAPKPAQRVIWFSEN